MSISMPTFVTLYVSTSLDESFSDVLKTYVRSSLRLNVTPDERYSRFVAAIKDEKNASPNDIKDLRRRKLLLMNFPNTKVGPPFATVWCTIKLLIRSHVYVLGVRHSCCSY